MSVGVQTVRHHKDFERIVLFDYRLTCRTGLHIGAGKSGELVGSDLPVLRDASGRPLIPGSSLRGILRSGVEAISATLQLDRAARRPAASPASDVPPAVAHLWSELDLVQRMFGYVAANREEAEKKGSAYGSRLQISDGVCESAPRIELRDGVAISRETRTAAGSAKFDVEVVPAGTMFQGSVRFKNPADYELGLLAQAFWMLDQGILLLGGKSARGLGWVEVAVSEPWELTAKKILEESLRPSSRKSSQDDFGPVAEKFQLHQAALLELEKEASSASANG